MSETSDYLTTGLTAVAIGGGLQAHHVDRLCRRGLIPHQLAGRIRLIAREDLPAVREAARAAGYIRSATPAATSKRRRAVAT